MAKTKTKTKTKASGGIGSLLGVAGSGSTKKSSRQETPIVHAPHLSKAIVAWREADRALKTADANKKQAAGQLIDPGLELHNQVCRRDQQLHSSVKLRAEDGQMLMLIQAQKYGSMPVEDHADQLQRLFGDEFDKYFRIDTTLQILLDQITEEEGEMISAALIEALGEARCREVLKQTSSVVPTENYGRDRILDERVSKKAKKAESEGLVKIQKPSFRSVA